MKKHTDNKIRDRNIVKDFYYYTKQVGKSNYAAQGLIAKHYGITRARVYQIVRDSKKIHTVNKPIQIGEIKTHISIENAGTLVVNGDPQEVYNFIKKAFQTPLDQLKEEVNKLTNEDAKMLLDVMHEMYKWAGLEESVTKNKKKRTRKIKNETKPEQIESKSNEDEEDPNIDDDRLKGLNFGSAT